MKKIFCVIIAAAFALALAACSKGDNAPAAAKSGLIGTFTYSDSILTCDDLNDDGNKKELRMYNSEERAVGGNMYCTVAPFNTIDGSRVSYVYDQRLRLKRDYTYAYQYNITLHNNEDWGNDFARLSVSIEGTFVYELVGGSEYAVRLNDPTIGTLTVYGATAIRPNDIYGWSVSSSPTYIEDVAAELERDANYIYNRFLAGRNVRVNKDEKALYDDIFYRDIMNDIAPYSDYTF